MKLVAVAFLLVIPSAGLAQAPSIRNPHEPLISCAVGLTEDLRMGEDDGPAAYVFGSIVSFDIDEAGNIYLLDMLSHKVSVFSHSGQWIRSFGRRGRGPGEFERPYRIKLSRNSVYVYDQGLGRLVRFTRDGRPKASALLPFNSSGQPSLAIDNAEHLYFTATPADSFPKRGPVIYAFDPRLNVVRSFGRVAINDSVAWRYLGSGPIEINKDGNLWFVPIGEYRIRKFDRSGRLLANITRDHNFVFSMSGFERITGDMGGRATVSFDTNRPLILQINRDAKGQMWVFVRDTPRKRTVIDVYDDAGKYVHRVEVPMRLGLSRFANGHFYGVTTTNGFPEIVRYKPSFSGRNRNSCARLY